MLSAMICLPGSKQVRSEKGFTLLELLMVVTILSTVAWMALGVVDNSSDQVRFEDTRNRLAAIKRAIIGDSSRTVNGHPVISGYVADMGSLPEDLASLISIMYCSKPEFANSIDCVDNGGIWVSQPEYSYNKDYNLYLGWRGPYLNTTSFGGAYKFRDGWGNDDGTANFGWEFLRTDELRVTSYGKDGVVSDSGTYEKDYPDSDAPKLIQRSEYAVLVNGNGGNGRLRVEFEVPSPCWVCSDTDDSEVAYDVSTRAECLDADITAETAQWVPVKRTGGETGCTDVDLDDDGDSDGVWLKPSDNGSICNMTSNLNPPYGENECADSGFVWVDVAVWNSDPEIKAYELESWCINPTLSYDDSGCTSAGGVFTSGVVDMDFLCLKVVAPENGVIGEVKKSDLGNLPLYWYASEDMQVREFELPADTMLIQGQAAFRVYLWDFETSSCSESPLPGGIYEWKPFTVIPGMRFTEPFEWDVE